MNKLIDPIDGENKAVRMFLALYSGARGVTVGAMRDHLRMSGFAEWPDWAAESHPGAHLTKGGAQLWLRHLFDLEKPPIQRLAERLAFMANPAQVRKLECNKHGMWRVYADMAPAVAPAPRFQALTSDFYPTAALAIDAAMVTTGDCHS